MLLTMEIATSAPTTLYVTLNANTTNSTPPTGTNCHYPQLHAVIMQPGSTSALTTPLIACTTKTTVRRPATSMIQSHTLVK